MIQGSKACRRRRRTVYAIRIAVNRFFSDTTSFKKSGRRGRLEAIGAEGTNKDHTVEGGSRLSEVRGERFSGSVMERVV